MNFVKTILDGTLPVKPLSYVHGDDWTYWYSDTWHRVEFDVHRCMNGELVAVINPSLEVQAKWGREIVV